jgi:hypothetical protein
MKERIKTKIQLKDLVILFLNYKKSLQQKRNKENKLKHKCLECWMK